MGEEKTSWRVVTSQVLHSLSWSRAWRSCTEKMRCSTRCCRGFRAQQVARGLRSETVDGRESLVRRFAETTNEYPWNWGPAHVEEWTLTLCSERHLAPSTIRGYQVDLRLFSEYVCDPRYGWGAACEDSFGEGMHPVPICHEWNTIAHLSG